MAVSMVDEKHLKKKAGPEGAIADGKRSFTLATSVGKMTFPHA